MERKMEKKHMEYDLPLKETYKTIEMREKIIVKEELHKNDKIEKNEINMIYNSKNNDKDKEVDLNISVSSISKLSFANAEFVNEKDEYNFPLQHANYRMYITKKELGHEHHEHEHEVSLNHTQSFELSKSIVNPKNSPPKKIKAEEKPIYKTYIKASTEEELKSSKYGNMYLKKIMATKNQVQNLHHATKQICNSRNQINSYMSKTFSKNSNINLNKFNNQTKNNNQNQRDIHKSKEREIQHQSQNKEKDKEKMNVKLSDSTLNRTVDENKKIINTPEKPGYKEKVNKVSYASTTNINIDHNKRRKDSPTDTRLHVQVSDFKNATTCVATDNENTKKEKPTFEIIEQNTNNNNEINYDRNNNTTKAVDNRENQAKPDDEIIFDNKTNNLIVDKHNEELLMTKLIQVKDSYKNEVICSKRKQELKELENMVKDLAKTHHCYIKTEPGKIPFHLIDKNKMLQNMMKSVSKGKYKIKKK